MPELPVTIWTAIASGALSVTLALIVTVAAEVSRRAQISKAAGARETWLLRAPLLPLVLAVIAGLVSVYALILHYAFRAVDFQLPATANITSPVVVAATLIAGVLTAAYAVLRLRAHLLTEAKGRLDAHGDERADERHRSDQEVAFTERFAKAVSLLASDQPISRIAGAHLILALGDEWLRAGAQQRCLDVLVSHLRGLRQSESFEDETGSRGVREEVRLITSEVVHRLVAEETPWKVRVGDFSGAVLADFDLTNLAAVALLDLRGSQVLGDLSIPATVSRSAPRLSGLVCEGDLRVEWGQTWNGVDLTNVEVVGSIELTGKVLPDAISGVNLRVGGDLSLAFKSFEGDVNLDAAVVRGGALIGSSDLGATFGSQEKPTMLSMVGASFGAFRLTHSSRGPQLDLTSAVGSVDLSHSVFPREVTVNDLDATAGFYLRGAEIKGPFVLDGATLPTVVDLDGLVLSASARSAIESSEFALRDRFLAHGQEMSPESVIEHDGRFDWLSAIESLRGSTGEDFMAELSKRLSLIDRDLPLDWQTRATFTARVMSEVSRAAAKVDAPESVQNLVQTTLRGSLGLAPTGEDR